MLVLTRKVGEQLQIGDGITLMVVRITPTAVRLGILAPPNSVIVRGELFQRLNEQEPRDDRDVLGRHLGSERSGGEPGGGDQGALEYLGEIELRDRGCGEDESGAT